MCVTDVCASIPSFLLVCLKVSNACMSTEVLLMLQGPISVDADKTNNRGEVSQPAAKAESRRWVNEDPSCSPLFPASPASQRFHKGFKSTACGSALGELYV